MLLSLGLYSDVSQTIAELKIKGRPFLLGGRSLKDMVSVAVKGPVSFFWGKLHCDTIYTVQFTHLKCPIQWILVYS